MLVSAENDPRRVGTIWTLNLDEPSPAITPLVAATFRSPGRRYALPWLRRWAAAPAEVHQRFETGRSCYTAWVEGQLAAYGWVSFEKNSSAN